MVNSRLGQRRTEVPDYGTRCSGSFPRQRNGRFDVHSERLAGAICAVIACVVLAYSGGHTDESATGSTADTASTVIGNDLGDDTGWG